MSPIDHSVEARKQELAAAFGQLDELFSQTIVFSRHDKIPAATVDSNDYGNLSAELDDAISFISKASKKFDAQVQSLSGLETKAPSFARRSRRERSSDTDFSL